MSLALPSVLLFIESNTSGTGRLFVQCARRMGLRPILMTARPERYRYIEEQGAPDVIVVPRIDEPDLAERIRLDFGGGAGVAGITSSSEYYIATAAALAARFGLPGPDAERVRAARSKATQREVLAAGGVTVPTFRVVESASDAARAARDIGFPVVVKPLGGSGSIGVRACANAGDVTTHAESLFAEGGESAVLVESHVAGPEFSVEVFSGRIVGITRKRLGAPPYFVEAGHDYPAELPREAATRLTDVVLRASTLLGLVWGPLHWELRLRDGEPIPMEVNPRLAGGFIPELVRHAQGIDLIRETLRLVVGDEPQLAPSHDGHSSIRFLFPPTPGRLTDVEGIDEVRSDVRVVDVALYNRPGEQLALRGDFRDRIGHVITCADSFEAAASVAESARDRIRIVVRPVVGAPRPVA